MNRAIRRFVSTLTGKNRFIFFLVIFLFCVIALCVGIYVQFFYKYVDLDPFMIGISIGSQKTAEELAVLGSNFNNLFQNRFSGIEIFKILIVKKRRSCNFNAL